MKSSFPDGIIKMKRHLLLTGFSCTGKTSLGEEAFGLGAVMDSDIELRKWIASATGKSFAHIFEIFIVLGRNEALKQIMLAEQSLIDIWANDSHGKIISLGPGFPLHNNWPNLRKVSYVVLFRRRAENIYNSFKARREATFKQVPEAKKHDNWDVDVIVDKQGNEFPPDVAIENIKRHITARERFYGDNDEEMSTENREIALLRLRDLKIRFDSGFTKLT